MGYRIALVIGLMTMGLTACTAEEAATLVAAAPEPSPSPSPGSPANDCWYDDIAVNGAENLPYPSESQAAGNTFYACYGDDSLGNEKGIWLAFYLNGTVYFGVPGVVLTPSLDNQTCTATFGAHGSSDYGVVDSNGLLTTIRLTVATYGEEIVYTCHVED